MLRRSALICIAFSHSGTTLHFMHSRHYIAKVRGHVRAQHYLHDRSAAQQNWFTSSLGSQMTQNQRTLITFSLSCEKRREGKRKKQRECETANSTNRIQTVKKDCASTISFRKRFRCSSLKPSSSYSKHGFSRWHACFTALDWARALQGFRSCAEKPGNQYKHVTVYVYVCANI